MDLDSFRECVETSENLAGFVIGFISLLLWLIPLFPQLYENYRRQSADGLSIYFLIFWIAGDSFNMLGALLTKQLPIQIIIGVYYIFQDILLFSQYIYYTGRSRWRIKLLKDLGQPSEVLSCVFFLCLTSPSLSNGLPFFNGRASVYSRNSLANSQYSGGGFQSRKLLSKQFFISAYDELGYALGTISALSYFAGRLPQLLKNYRRKSTEGVSVAMFVIIVFWKFDIRAVRAVGGTWLVLCDETSALVSWQFGLLFYGFLCDRPIFLVHGARGANL